MGDVQPEQGKGWSRPGRLRRVGLLAVSRLLSLAVLFAALAPAPLHAQSDADKKWLLLPSVVATEGDPKHPARAAARLLAEELRSHGRRAFTMQEGKALFEQHGSAPPMTASAADIDELAKDAQRALYHVASGLPARAKVDVERALDRARRALESLNRETRAAQHLLDACLYLVRAHLQRGSRGEARRQALECRRLVPDIAPEPTVHPPDVIGVLAEAQAQLRSDEPAALRIESEPLGCAAYVNGRNLGPTPKELSRLSPGEYRIQAECEPGVMGRVHRVALSNNRVVMRVDTRYDRAIETLFDLSLNYASSSEELRYLARDAVETARVVGASDVLVAFVESSGPQAVVKIDRYRVADGVHLGFVRLSVQTRAGTVESRVLALARTALEANAPADLTGPVPQPLAPSDSLPSPGPPESPPTAFSAEATVADVSSAPPDDPLALDTALPPESEAADDSGAQAGPVIGIVLGGIGLATQLTGWVLYAGLLSAQDDYAAALQANGNPTMRTTAELTALRDLRAADTPPKIGVGVGALVGTVALPFWLPEADGMPVWGWASLGVGVGFAAAGTAFTAAGVECEKDRYGRCTDAPLSTDLGPLLLMQAVPFLAVPVVLGIRDLTGSDAHVELRVGPDSALLRVAGEL